MKNELEIVSSFSRIMAPLELVSALWEMVIELESLNSLESLPTVMWALPKLKEFVERGTEESM